MCHSINNSVIIMRGIIKIIILWVSSILNYNHKSKVLFYHDVFCYKSYKSLDTDILLGTPLSAFKKHIAEINKAGYEIVPEITKPQRQVAIMFDDGFRGIWDNKEFFKENHIIPTVFLAVDLIGKEGFLNKDEILELQNKWGFIFQCHSWHHTDLSRCNEQQLYKELRESKLELSRILRRDVTALCLPKGYFSDALLKSDLLKEYETVYSSIPGNFFEKVKGMRTRNLCQFASSIEVRLILKGGNELIKNRYMRLHHQPNYE
jgi:peptidoglycan/xylan/chitin deacetylase (PgdA/CDA1 family)